MKKIKKLTPKEYAYLVLLIDRDLEKTRKNINFICLNKGVRDQEAPILLETLYTKKKEIQKIREKIHELIEYDI